MIMFHTLVILASPCDKNWQCFPTVQYVNQIQPLKLVSSEMSKFTYMIRKVDHWVPTKQHIYINSLYLYIDGVEGLTPPPPGFNQ